MGIFILAGALGLAAFAVLLFAKGGARESATAVARPYPTRTDPAQLDALTRQAIAALGLRIESTDASSHSYLAVDPTPLTGQRVHVRAFALPDEERLGEAEVQSALETVHTEGYHRALLICPTGFSDEAILAAQDGTVELIDGGRLSDLLSTTPARPALLGRAVSHG